MKNWRHTKLGRYLWQKFWYRVDWYLGERAFVKWLKYAERKAMYVNITPGYLRRMQTQYDNPKRKNILNLFKPYEKWFDPFR